MKGGAFPVLMQTGFKVTGVGTMTPVINLLKLDIAWREMLSSCHNTQLLVYLGNGSLSRLDLVPN